MIWHSIRTAKKRRKPPGNGELAEQYSVKYLKKQGLKIVATNYSCKSGEIDIIVRHGDTLAFIEVRLRNHVNFASGAESVDFTKQKKLIATANHFLQQTFNNQQPPCRFDVMSLTRTTTHQSGFEVDWIQDAFRPEY